MTSRAFTGGWLVAATLLSSWAVSWASDRRQADPRGARAADAHVPAYTLPPLSAEVDAQVARLSARTFDAAPAAAPARNPFKFDVRRSTFGVPPPVRARDLAQPATSERPASSSELPAPPPAPGLAGIADASGDGTLTAVISFRDQLHYVKKGDVIAARYRVDAVRADGVDLFDIGVGTILRLSLQRLT